MKTVAWFIVVTLGTILTAPGLAAYTVYFEDDFEQYTDISTANYPDTSGDYDPDVVTLWVDSEWYIQDIQVTNYSLPGPGQGRNYLRVYQTGSNASTPVAKLSERVIYQDITVDLLIYVPATGAGRILLQDGGTNTEFIRFNETGVGSIAVLNSGGAWTNLTATIQEDVWTRITIRTDMYDGTYQISVDGGPPEIGHSTVTFGHEKVQIYPTGKVSGGNAGMFFDDLTVYTGTIPKPPLVVVEEGDATEVAEEGATSDTFTVDLGSDPNDSVTVTLFEVLDPPGSASQIIIDPCVLYFAPGGGSGPQEVTVTAIDDEDAEGDLASEISFTLVSDDPNYTSTNPDVVARIQNVSVRVLDDDMITLGHQILIDRGLQIQALLGGETVAPLTDARLDESYFTGVLMSGAGVTGAHHEAVNPPILGRQWGRFSVKATTAISRDEHSVVSDLVGLQVGDEEDLDDTALFNWSKALVQNLKGQFPEALVFTNQYSTQVSMATMQDFVTQARPDMVSYDAYRFPGSTYPFLRVKYEELQAWRELGLAGYDGAGKEPIPYAHWLQHFIVNGHTVSESEARLDAFSAWAFGYKVAMSFFYNGPGGDSLEPILFTGDGDATPTAAFTYVAETNRQSLNLGPALVRLLSTDIRILLGQHVAGIVLDNEQPDGVDLWDASADPYITAITPSNPGTVNSGLNGDVLVGYFELLKDNLDGPEYSNEMYFMVVNGLVSPTATAAQAQQTIRLDFDFSGATINSLQRLNRDTGAVEVVALVNDGGDAYHLDLVLDGGTGDLFKFNTGAEFVISGGEAGIGQGTPPEDCEEAVAWGYGSAMDLNGDCHVTLLDFSIMAQDWQRCIDPADEGCETPWE